MKAAVVPRIGGKCEVREVPTPELPCRLLRFERRHINREAVFYIGLEQSLISLIDLLDRDDFYVGCYVMFAAKVKHFLCFGNTSNKRTRKTTTLEYEAKASDDKRLRRRADQCNITVSAEQLDVCVNVVFGRDGVEDEVEAAGVLLHLLGISRNDHVVCSQAESIFFLIRRCSKDHNVRSKRMSKLHRHVA